MTAAVTIAPALASARAVVSPGPGPVTPMGLDGPSDRPARVGIARGDRVDAVLAHEERARGCASR